MRFPLGFLWTAPSTLGAITLLRTDTVTPRSNLCPSKPANCALPNPPLTLPKYRESTQEQLGTREELWTLLGLDLPLCGPGRTCPFCGQPTGICSEGFSWAGGGQSHKRQDPGTPTSEAYSDPTSQLSSGMRCSCMWEHLLPLYVLSGQPDSTPNLSDKAVPTRDPWWVGTSP